MDNFTYTGHNHGHKNTARGAVESWCPKQESDLRLVLTKDVFYH